MFLKDLSNDIPHYEIDKKNQSIRAASSSTNSLYAKTQIDERMDKNNWMTANMGRWQLSDRLFLEDLKLQLEMNTKNINQSFSRIT